jgi:TPP-dependent 2-oxoacid decarboxylase
MLHCRIPRSPQPNTLPLPKPKQKVYDIVQEQLLSEPGYDVVVDTGDALWRSHALRLPEGAAYETQCLAGNIGAGLPTALGFSLGAAAGGAGRRTVLFQGDGGLQMTAQDIGTFARFGSTAVVVLINNDGYLVERYLSPIAHSSYNYLAPWDYSAVADAMCRRITGAKYRVLRATTRDEAAAAIAEAKALRDHFVFIECVVSPKDAAPGARWFVLFRCVFGGGWRSASGGCQDQPTLSHHHHHHQQQ